MLLEDLLEQEKREKEERERQATVGNEMNNQNSSSLLSDQDFERLRADVLGTTQGIPAQGLLPIQQQQVIQTQSQQPQPQFVTQNASGIRQQFIHRNINQGPPQQQQVPQQHMTNQAVFHQHINKNPKQLPIKAPIGAVFHTTAQMINPSEQDIGTEATVVKKEGCSIPMFVANLQAAPTLPPDTIVTEQDRQMQINYEQWLSTQENVLNNQRKYYETEVSKLRKTKKSLNSKQRVLKKAGNDLTESDTLELNKVTAEQSIVQKQLENARKQSRQHTLVIQDYKNKQQAASMKSNLARQQMGGMYSKQSRTK